MPPRFRVVRIRETSTESTSDSQGERVTKSRRAASAVLGDPRPAGEWRFLPRRVAAAPVGFR